MHRIYADRINSRGMSRIFSLFTDSLHGKADTFFLHINTKNTDIHDISHTDCFQRMFDEFLAHLGNMDQAIL